MNPTLWYAKPRIIALTSVFSVGIIMFVSYIMNNNPYPIFDDIDKYARLEYGRRLFAEEKTDSNVFYINVAYDKKLIDYADPFYGMPQGQVDITDRTKLAELLDHLQQADNYKYAFLDVRFEEGYADEDSIDSRLYEAIKRTPRLVISNHKDITLADSTLLPKSALSDFSATITATNFVRYQYLYDDRESVPLRMYHELQGRTIERHGCFYFCNGHLATNCPFLQIARPFPEQYDADGNLQYYNLGADILDLGLADNLSTLVQGKYVVIGNFIDDVHDTYVGMQPGSYISYVAYDALARGVNLVHWPSQAVMAVIYLLCAIFMFSRVSVIDHIPGLRSARSRTLRFIISTLGITFLMEIVTDTMYIISGETFTMWFPALFFTILSTLISYRDGWGAPSEA